MRAKVAIHAPPSGPIRSRSRAAGLHDTGADHAFRSVSGHGTDVIVVPGLVDLEREFLDFEWTQALRRVQTAQARHRCPSVSNDLEPVKIVAIVREGDVQGVPRDNADLGASLRELVEAPLVLPERDLGPGEDASGANSHAPRTA